MIGGEASENRQPAAARRSALLSARQLSGRASRASPPRAGSRQACPIDLAALAIKLAVGASPDDQLDGHGANPIRGRFSHCTTSQGVWSCRHGSGLTITTGRHNP